MKKLIYCALALAAGLFATSCQQELLETAGGNTVTFTVQMPTVATKATIGNDASSINDLVYAVYRTTANDLETTLGDWDKYASLVYQKNPSETVFTDNFSTSVSLELINNQNYVILFWAQKNDVWVAGENFDLTKITYPADEDGNVNMVVNRGVADKYAAFSAVRFLAAEDFAGKKTVELTRPFAQINIAAKNPVNYDVVVNSSSMTVGSAGDMFNVASQDAAATKNITYTWENIPATDGYVAGGVTYDHYVAMGYVFANGNVSVSYDINTADHGTVTNVDAPISNVPVAANYRTNIVGKLLTSTADYEVTLDKNWEAEYNVSPDGGVIKNTYVESASEIQEIINELNNPEVQSAIITLNGDINLNVNTKTNSVLQSITVPAGKTLTIDLNGYTLTGAKSEDVYAITNEGDLIINDSKTGGAITGVVYDGQGAKTVINGGTYNALEGDAYVLLNNGGTLIINKATINGGTSYPLYSYNANSRLVINYAEVNATFGCVNAYGDKDGYNSTVEINGGTFNMTGVQGTTSHIAYFSRNCSVIINGGTFKKIGDINMSASGGGGICATGGANLTINGGSFEGDHADVYNWGKADSNTTIAIKGGTYKFEPTPAEGYKVEVEEDGKYVVVKKPDVAMIGETGYWSLNAAVAAVEDGQTIALVSDIEQVDGVIITDKNITIDLNDKTFTVSEGASTNNRNFKINGSSVVTIKNGTMVAAADYSSGAYGTLRTEGTANVTLENVKLYNYRGNGLNVKALSGTTVTINNTEIYSQYGGGVEAAGGNVVLNDVTIDQKGMYTAPYNSMAISVNGGGTATVNSGVYSTECITAEEANNQGTSHGPWCAGVLNSGGTLIIKGGTFSNDNFGDNSLATAARGLLLADTGANIQVEDGTFNAIEKIIDIQNNLGDASKNPKATLMGGTFSSNPLTWDGLISVAADYKLVEAEGVFNVVVDPVAKIGETACATLQDAFNVGGEITLLRDVVLGETVVLAEGKTAVLDLNGKTLSHEDEANKYAINNHGTLTITGNGTVNARGIYNGYNNGGTPISSAKLTIENGTFNAKGTNGGACVFNYGTAEIKGGSFTSIGSYSLNNQDGSSMSVAEGVTANNGIYTSNAILIVNGGAIEGNRSGCHVLYSWNSSVEINGGNFYNNNSGNSTLMAAGTSTMVVNGGTFGIKDGRVPGNGNTWTSCLTDIQNSASLNVNGGTFNGGFRVQTGTTMTINAGSFNDCYGSNYNIYGTASVKGGTYTDATAQNFAKNHLAEGYEMNANGEVVAK